MFRKAAKKPPISIVADLMEADRTQVAPPQPKKRPRGIEAQSLFPQAAKTEDFPLVQKVFVRSTEKLDNVHNRHMENYIQQRLASKDSDRELQEICQKINEEQRPQSPEEEEELFKVPKRFQSDDSIYEKASEKTNWLSGLAEVPLTIEHKLDNIEQTENSKRRILKSGGSLQSRFEDIHYEEVEAFHARRIKGKIDANVFAQLEKEMQLTRRDRKREEGLRRMQNRAVEDKAHQ